MLKQNSFAIAIVTLGLVMASNAFGQERPKRPNKNDKPEKATSIITPMYVANQEEYMAGGTADIRGGTRDLKESFEQNSNARTKQNNSASKPNEQNKNCMEFEAVKSPRDTASGQATGIKLKPKTTVQYNPKEIGIDKVSPKKNLGDTATHERRRKDKN